MTAVTRRTQLRAGLAGGAVVAWKPSGRPNLTHGVQSGTPPHAPPRYGPALTGPVGCGWRPGRALTCAAPG